MKKYIQIFAMLAVLTFFIFLVSQNIGQFKLSDLHLNFGLLALSLACLQLSFVVEIFILRKAFRLMKVDASIGFSYKIYFISNLGRYIPGRIWQFVAMSYFAKKRGVSISESSSVFILNQVVSIATCVIYVTIFGLIFSDIGRHFSPISLLPISPVLLILFFPNTIISFLNFVLNRLKRPLILIRITSQYMAFLFLAYAVTFSLIGLGFVLLARGLGLPVEKPIFTMAVYPLSYIIGYVSLLTPGGIGVRESVMIFLLKMVYPGNFATALSVGSLFWFAGLDLTNGLLALSLSRGKSAIFSESEKAIEREGILNG